MIPRIALCTPTRDICSAEFNHSVEKMIGHFATNFIATGQAETVTLTDVGTLLPDMRNTLARVAIEHGATHVLWLDNDMIFPVDMIERLYQHGKPIVAANYSQRKRPCKPVAAKDGLWVYTEENSSGLEMVDYVGMGCMLVETAIYESIPKPWHMLAWNEKKQEIVGEDVYFCRKARAAGADIWIDHDLSKEVFHIGYHNYSYKDALNDRPEMIERQAKKAAEKSAA